jgi:hypothetical protein
MSVIAKILEAHALNTARQFVNRHLTLSASKAGGCLRRDFYDKQILRRSADTRRVDWGATTRGNMFERWFWYPALKARYGRDLHYAGSRQRTFTFDKLSATPDAVIGNQPRDSLKDLGVADLGPGRCFIADAKTIDPRVILHEPKIEHVAQLQVQMGIIRRVTRFKPLYGILSYTDASFWSETVEYVVAYSERVFQNMLKRAETVLAATSAGDIAPEGWIAGGEECRYCPHAEACSRERTGVPAPTGTPSIDPAFHD